MEKYQNGNSQELRAMKRLHQIAAIMALRLQVPVQYRGSHIQIITESQVFAQAVEGVVRDWQDKLDETVDGVPYTTLYYAGDKRYPETWEAVATVIRDSDGNPKTVLVNTVRQTNPLRIEHVETIRNLLEQQLATSTK